MTKLSTLIALTTPFIVNICAQELSNAAPVFPTETGEPDLDETSITGINDSYRARLIEDAKSIRTQVIDLKNKLEDIKDVSEKKKKEDEIISLLLEASALESIAGVPVEDNRTFEEKLAAEKKSLLDESENLFATAQDVYNRLDDESLLLDSNEKIKMRNRAAELEKIALEKNIGGILLGLSPQQAIDLVSEIETKYNVLKQEYDDKRNKDNEYMLKVLVDTLSSMEYRILSYVNYAKEISAGIEQELVEIEKNDKKAEKLDLLRKKKEYKLTPFIEKILKENDSTTHGNAHRASNNANPSTTPTPASTPIAAVNRRLHADTYLGATAQYERYLPIEFYMDYVVERRRLQQAATLTRNEILPQSVYNNRNPNNQQNFDRMEPTYANAPANVLDIFPENPAVVEHEKKILVENGMPQDKALGVAKIFEKLGRLKQASDTIDWHLKHWDVSASISNISDPKLRNEAIANRVLDIGRRTRFILDKELPLLLKEDDMTKEQMEFVAKAYENTGIISNEWTKHPSSKTVSKDLIKEVHQVGKDFIAQTSTLLKKSKKLTSKPESFNKDSLVFGAVDSVSVLNDQLKALEAEHTKIKKVVDSNKDLDENSKKAFEEKLKTITTEIDLLKNEIKTHQNRERELPIKIKNYRNLHHEQRRWYTGRPYYGAGTYSMPAVYSQPILYQAQPVILQQPIQQPVIYQKQAPPTTVVYQSPQPVQMVYQQPILQAVSQPVYSAPPVVQQVQQPIYTQPAPKKFLRRLAEATEDVHSDVNNVASVFFYGKVTKNNLVEEAFALRRQSLLMRVISKLVDDEEIKTFKNDYADWLEDLSTALLEKSKTVLMHDIDISKADLEDRIKLKTKYLKQENEMLEKSDNKDITEYHKNMIKLWNEAIESDQTVLNNYTNSNVRRLQAILDPNNLTLRVSNTVSDAEKKLVELKNKLEANISGLHADADKILSGAEDLLRQVRSPDSRLVDRVRQTLEEKLQKLIDKIKELKK